MTTQPKKTTKNAQETKLAFIKELVAVYGEGTVVSHKQMLDVAQKTDFKRFINGGISAIRHDNAYKVGRNQYVVTLSETPATVRDKTATNVAKLTAKKEAQKLPKQGRQSPKKLLKAIAPEVAKSKFVDENDMVGFEQEEENINDLLTECGIDVNA